MLKIFMAEEAIEERETVEPDELAIISDVFKTFTKTLKAFNVYPKDNPIYKKFATELYQKFESFFSGKEDLLLSVEQFSLFYKGHEIFHSDDRTDNLALFLFMDGIREICFQRGLTFEEIVDLIDVLRFAPKEENLDDDIVTLLWEKDMEHLSYFVPEDVDEGEMEAEQDFIPEGSVETATTASGATYSDVTIKPVAFDLKVEPLSAEEKNALRDEATRQDRDYLLAAALELFFELMPLEDDISNFVVFVKNIKRIADMKMESNRITEVVEMLKRLKAFSTSLRITEKKDAIRDVINKFGSVEDIKKVLGSPVAPETLDEYLLTLGTDSINSMIEVLGELEDRKLRRLLCNVLAECAIKDMELFGKFLKDGRWFLVRNIVMILGMTKDARAVKFIEQVVSHPELRVRREAIKALESIRAPEARRPLMAFLRDDDSTARVNALRALRRYGDGELLKFLREQIENEDFKLKPFAEKREFLDAFGEVGKDEAFPVLSGFFKKKGFFRRDENLELRASAAYGLGRIGTPEAIAMLESEANSKKSLLREACQRALKGASKK
jgi:hypothetical protein